MRVLAISLLVLATTVASMVASTSEQGALRRTQVDKKKTKKCRAARSSGPIIHGSSCTRKGLSCAANRPICRDIFNPETKTCSDVRSPCVCDGQSWNCAKLLCMAPDDRCNCNDPGLVSHDSKCYRKGLECPHDEATVTCYGIWNQGTKKCYDQTFTPSCMCEGGVWLCEVIDCAAPDPRCT